MDRTESRRRWASAATGWEQQADWLHRASMPVSSWMVDAIAPQPGHTILELAAGTGDTGFLAAELIEPGGTLICSDFSPEMLAGAQRRAEQLGIRNVRFRQIDASVIDQPAASLDGVLCRWGFMLMPDGEAALRETRRILKPGGRVALAAWTGPEENPWGAQPWRVLADRGLMEPEDTSQPGPFAWSADGAIAERLQAAGFVEHEIDVVEFTLPYDSVEDWWNTTRTMSSSFAQAVAGLDDDTVAEIHAALREATGADGPIALPARTWVAAATA